MTDDKDVLWDIIEPFVESGLFRDLNILKYNLQMQDFVEQVLSKFSLDKDAE